MIANKNAFEKLTSLASKRNVAGTQISTTSAKEIFFKDGYTTLREILKNAISR